MEKRMKKGMEEYTKKLDRLHESYRRELGKEIGVPPSKRPDFEACSIKYIRKYLKYPLDDMELFKDSVVDIVDTCSEWFAIPSEVPKPKRKLKPKKEKKMSGWVCYLKTCAKESDMDYRGCMKDESRKDKEYYLKKPYWITEAKKGCPSGL